jgi:hypothetical protein
VARWSGDARTAATAAALAPYSWRDLTDRMLARLVVGAADRHGVTVLLASLPGTDPGPADAVEPTDPDDPRVEVLVRVLADRRWRGLTLERLATDLLAALDAWQVGRDVLDRDLRRPSGGR